MAEHPEDDLVRQFQTRLLAAIDEVTQHTRIGVKGLRATVEAAGAWFWAREQLSAVGPFAYFTATKRIGRMDLSVEAIALKPQWKDLFTREQAGRAMDTLSEHGFDPDQGHASSADSGGQVPILSVSSFAPIRIDDASEYDEQFGRVWYRPHGLTGCEMVAAVAEQLHSHQLPPARHNLRRHLGECRSCCASHPEVGMALREFDQRACRELSLLLTSFQITLNFVDEPIDPHFREFYAWRATILGCQVGRFMAALSDTFEGSFYEDSLWLVWRKGDVQGEVSDFVRKIDRKEFELALSARSLASVFSSCPCVEDGVLWLPAYEDLTPIPGVLRVDRCSLEEWEKIFQYDYIEEGWPEFLEAPPENVNTLALLSMAWQAAARDLDEIEPATRAVEGTGPAEGLALLRSMVESQSRIIEGHDAMFAQQAEDRERQNAIISCLERMVLNMKNTDRYNCEESLRHELPGVYDELEPKARSLCVASQQTYQIQGFAAPAQIILGLAIAFELQLRHSVISRLFEHLKHQGIQKLSPLPEWKDVEQNKPLWLTSTRADKCNLGTTRLILRHNHPSIGEFFLQFGLDRTTIQQALESVYPYRNPAAHGESFDIGTAEAIRNDWLHWNKRPGGIFSIFFRNR